LNGVAGTDAEEQRSRKETNINEQANTIWGIADLLRSDFKQSKCGKVIQPFTILRRFNCVLG